MNKELSDVAWRVLPSEFKEEVKKQFRDGFNDDREAIGRLFGIDNLLSDAEREEILTVSRKQVQKMYSYNEEELTKDPTNKGALLLKLRLDALFGSKCLPDEEPKFKHKIGDKVRIVNDISHNNKYNGDITEIVYVDESDSNMPYKVDIYDEEFGGGLWYQESDLEPYTEPTDLNKSSETCTDNCSSPDHFVAKDEMVDNIIKDGFAKERRLNIAAQMAQSILRNNDEIYRASVESKAKTTPAAIAEYAFALADALLAECEKKGGQDA